MKTKVVPIFALLLLTMGFGQGEVATVHWQEDLDYLQRTVHESFPFLFKKISASDFDGAVAEFRERIPAMDSHEVVVGFAKIVALFEYGHTRVRLTRSPVSFRKLPLQLYQFPEGLFITGAHADHKAVVGGKVLQIAGKPISEVLQAIRPVVPIENEQFFKAYGLGMALIPEVLHAQGITNRLRSRIPLTVMKEGKTFDVRIPATKELDFPLQYGEVELASSWVSARDLTNPPLYLKDLEKPYAFDYLPEERAVYVRQSEILDGPLEPISAFYERVFDFVDKNPVDRFILDVRLNGGGNNFKNKPIVLGILRHPKINAIGKLYVIIGRRTFSACQNLVNEIHNYAEAIFVGEPTGENVNFYGDAKRILLPNSQVPVFLSHAWWQDKPPWDNAPYTSPELPMAVRFEDYQANRDPVLERALTFDGTNFIKAPKEYFTNLFLEQKLDLLRSEAKRMINDSLYRGFAFEQEFNRAGFQLLDTDRVEEALFIFELNTDLFPDSAYAWYSLGEAYKRAGRFGQAKTAYGRAVTLDPEGVTGNYAREGLKTLDGSGGG